MKKLSVHQTHHVPKCLSCHKAILVMTGRTNCFHDYICVMPILLLQDLSTLCVMDTYNTHFIYNDDNNNNIYIYIYRDR